MRAAQPRLLEDVIGGTFISHLDQYVSLDQIGQYRGARSRVNFGAQFLIIAAGNALVVNLNTPGPAPGGD